MSALDTNVLVRWLVEPAGPEDVNQAATARRLMTRTLADGDRLFVPITVTLELEWVLRSRYKQTKAQFLQVLGALLNTVDLEFDHERALEEALLNYRSTAAELADCLHAAIAAQAGAGPLLTFDRAAAKVGGADLLR
ncbi:type II toxin-antitoxin system VapC family toxin [soil metagenome]